MPRGSILLALVVALLACSPPQEVGYDGPLPSSEARAACLTPIIGRSFVDASGALGGGELFVVGFVVGAAPTVRLERERGSGDFLFIEVYTDGDVADLYERVTGERMARFEGELSESYRARLGS